MDYWSVDLVLENDNAVQYMLEVLNTLNPLGFAAHRLVLKIGIPVMLLRNLCPPKLCNGTTTCDWCSENVVEATIITGCAKGESVVIPHNFQLPFWVYKDAISYKSLFCSDNQ